MEKQSYANHARYVPLFHFVTSGLILVTVIGAIARLIQSFWNGSGILGPVQWLLVSLILVSLFFFARQFPLKAQDRAIRAEENLRHFVLTGKLLDPKLDIHQVIALRFAPDEEFVGLAEKAVAENMRPDDIKRAVRNWRADYHRA